MSISFKQVLNKDRGATVTKELTEKKETIYKVKDGETGPNKDLRYKETSSGWQVSRDVGKTWKQATSNSPSPMYNTDDIEMEKDMGFIVKV